MPDITVQSLGPQNLAQFLAFFDGDAFADNPRWSSCYCQCFYESHAVVRWADRTAAQNRDRACQRVSRGEMQGYMALADGQPVGWCNAVPTRLLHAFADEAPPDADTVGFIACFLVSPAHRGQGVARRLLQAACDGLQAQGMTVAEANPRVNAATPAQNHHGPLSLYLSAGFTVHREDTDGSVFVRRPLGAPGAVANPIAGTRAAPESPPA